MIFFNPCLVSRDEERAIKSEGGRGSEVTVDFLNYQGAREQGKKRMMERECEGFPQVRDRWNWMGGEINRDGERGSSER